MANKQVANSAKPNASRLAKAALGCSLFPVVGFLPTLVMAVIVLLTRGSNRRSMRFALAALVISVGGSFILQAGVRQVELSPREMPPCAVEGNKAQLEEYRTGRGREEPNDTPESR